LLSFSVCCNTGTYSALKAIYYLLLLKSLLWENIVYTMGLIVEVVIWDKLILYPRQTKISTNQMIVEFMGAGLKLLIPQNTLLLNQVHFLVWSRYSIHFPRITLTDSISLLSHYSSYVTVGFEMDSFFTLISLKF
jgi:hypothetical protein